MKWVIYTDTLRLTNWLLCKPESVCINDPFHLFHCLSDGLILVEYTRHLEPIMDSKKRKDSDTGGSARKRPVVLMETKAAITKKLISGEKIMNVARTFNINCSSVATRFTRVKTIFWNMWKVQCLCRPPLSARNGVS